MPIKRDDIPRVVEVLLKHLPPVKARALVGDLVRLQLNNQSAQETFDRIWAALEERRLELE